MISALVATESGFSLLVRQFNHQSLVTELETQNRLETFRVKYQMHCTQTQRQICEKKGLRGGFGVSLGMKRDNEV